MVAQGNLIFRWRNLQSDHEAEIQFRIHCGFIRSIGLENNQPFLTSGIVGGEQAFAIVQPGQMAIAYAIRLAMLQNRSFPVCH